MDGTGWDHAAQNVQFFGCDIKDQVAYCASGLIYQVLHATCTIDELRGGLRWANALDAEAVRLGIDLTARGDGTEALARRIAHHAGRSALTRVRTATRMQTEHVRHMNNVAKKY